MSMLVVVTMMTMIMIYLSYCCLLDGHDCCALAVAPLLLCLLLKMMTMIMIYLSLLLA